MSRIDKVNQQLKREIGSVIQRELSDPRVEFVTITHVETSRDLKHAKVHFSVLGDSSQLHAAQEGLSSARGLIRKYIGQQINMRYTPELVFVYDKSIEASARIEKTLEEIHHEHEENHQND